MMHAPAFSTAAALPLRRARSQPGAQPARRPRSPPTASAATAVKRIRSPAAFAASLDALATPGSGRARVAVVGFTSASCRACAYAAHAYARVAGGGGEGGVFYEVDVGEAALQEVCVELGVESVPSWRVFASGEEGGKVYEVEEVVGPREVRRLEEVVERLVQGGFDAAEFE